MARVEHQTAGERITREGLEFFQALEVASVDGGGGLDLDAYEPTQR
jgi:hypothetical protein